MAAGSNIEVRLITGEAIQVQISPEIATIRELKKRLAQERDSLAGCHLFLNGQQLRSATPLAALPLVPGAFLVALEGRARPAAAAAPQQPQEPEASHVTPPDAASPRKLDTLLPGYLSRPQPSPSKRPQQRGAERAAAEPAEEEAAPGPANGRGAAPSLLELAAASRLREDLLREAAQAAAATAAAPPQEAAPPRPAPRKTTQRNTGKRSNPASGQEAVLPGLPALPEGAAAAALPLPPFLRRLESAFRRVITMHDFFQRNRLQCTWAALERSLGGAASGGDCLTLDDLRLMEALCPRALHLAPHVSAAEDPEQRRDAWREGGASEPLQAAEPAPGDAPGLLVTMVDPWQARFGDEPPPPAAFLEEMAAAKAAAAAAAAAEAPGSHQTIEDEVEQAVSDDVEGDGADGLGFLLPPGAKGRQRGARPNKRRRIEWEFRKGALRAVALIQARHFGGAVPPLPLDFEQPQRRRAPARPARRSKAARQQAAAAAAAVPEPADEISLVDDEEPADLGELMAAGRWHPAFPLAAATPAAVAAAAAELRAAQRAADDAADASADALAAARAAAAAGPAPPPPPKRARPAAPPQLLKKHAPCMDTSPLAAPAFLEHLQALAGYQGQVVHVERLPERAAALAALDPPPPAPVAAALTARGISPSSLYSHQAAAIASLRARRHTVVATATASGKSLCYAVPILEALVADAAATALLIFPTKALAQDQLRALRGMAAAAGLGAAAAAIYDGDTPAADRPAIRDATRIILTNPDMVHCSLLPVHPSFSRFLSGLAVVVVDEGHAYKGAFGCHVALVLRRLRRVCDRGYGARPVFAVTTATLANPGQHAAALLGVGPGDVEVVDRDGSPHGAKDFVLWNPPLRSPGGEGGGGRRWAKREAEEAGRAALRAARQERHAGVMLGPGTASEAAWEAAVGAGARDPVAKARARAAASGPGGSSLPGSTSVRSGGGAPQPQLTARQRALAAQAAAAVSAAAGPGAHPDSLPALRPVDSSGAAVPPRRVISVGPSSARAAAAPEEGRLPEGVAAKAAAARARVGSSGAAPSAARTSPIVEIAALLAEAVQHRLRTIAFCKSRKLAELVTAYVREILATTAPGLASRVAVYRAGYSPAERREIEGALFSGALLGVAATNALELGVDVGGLDATLHLGFPGSIASLWQQAGRAGRRGQPSVSIYVGWDGPLDQFFFSHPAALFSRPVEAALVDPGNPAALEAHVACAAAEAPLRPAPADDGRFFGAGLPAAVAALQSRRLLSAATLAYIGAADNPAAGVTLRAIDPGRFSIIDESAPGGGRVLEEVEASKAFYQVYDGGTYFFQGRTFLCRKLDLEARVALVRPADVKYFTRPVDFTAVTVVGGGESAFPAPPASQISAGSDFLPTSARADAAAVTTRWLGFVRVWRGTGQVFDSVDLFLPDVRYETTAAHLRLPPSARAAVEAAGLPFRDSLHAAAHAVLNALPLYLMVNPQDVGTECDHPYDTRYKPERILLYDKAPGGVGLAAAAAPRFTELLVRALALVEGCACCSGGGEEEQPAAGCPSCVQHLDCGEYNAVLCKRGAVLVLRAALEAEAQRFGLDLRRLGLGGGEGAAAGGSSGEAVLEGGS